MTRGGASGLLVVALLACTPTASRDGVGASARREGPAAPRLATTTCEVARIVDGDTLVCVPDVRVRLIGMDTPEMRQSPYGTEARDTLAALLPVGSTVELEPDIDPSDRYGRVLAYVWRDDMLVNWWLVQNGWARILTVPPNVRYVDQLVEAQRVARTERRGFWGTGGFACGPDQEGDRGC